MYNAPIFLYFQADWCRYCDLLERELLDTKQGKQALSKAVKVLITPENGAQEKRLFKQMRGKGYPTTLIKQPHGSAPIKYTLIRKVNNSWTTKSAGYLEQIINPIY